MGVQVQAQEWVRNDSISVGTSAVNVSLFRTSTEPRKDIVLRNNSTAATSIITINLGMNGAVAGYGIILKQYESFIMSQDAGAQIFQGTITAICADANGTLAIMER